MNTETEDALWCLVVHLSWEMTLIVIATVLPFKEQYTNNFNIPTKILKLDYLNYLPKCHLQNMHGRNTEKHVPISQ